MGVLPPTKTTQYLLACLSLWCTGALLAVCHDATDPAVDSGVIAKRGAAPHSGIRIKRAPSREPVLLAALLLSALPSDNVPTAVVYSEPLRIVCQSGWQEEETE